MPNYAYKAISATGEETSAHIQAADESEAIESISKEGLSVVELTVVGGTETGFEEAQVPASTTTSIDSSEEYDVEEVVDSSVRAKTEVILFFYEQTSFLLGAGIPLYLCVKMVIENLKDARFIGVLKDIMFELTEGSTLSSSMKKYPKCFPRLHTQLISVGESTGQMDKVLNYVVDLSKEQNEIREKLVKAISYPVFILGMSSALIFVMIVVVFPQFESIFKSFNVDLPATTQFFMSLGNYIRGNMGEVVLGVAGFVGGIAYFFKSDSMADTRESIILSIPGISDVYLSMFVSVFSKNLGSLLKSGLPILEALEICRDTLAPEGSLRYEFIYDLIIATREGEPLSEAMESTEFVPEMVWQLTRVGEQTGNLGSMMDNIFTFYKKRYLNALEKVTAVIRPAMMITSAVLIGVVALSLFLPLFGLSSGLKRG